MNAPRSTVSALAAAAALAAAGLLLACSASTSTLPDDAPTMHTTLEGPPATCSAPTGEAVITLDDPPVRLVEGSGGSTPVNRIELAGTITGYGGHALWIVAGGADALCPLVETTRVDLIGDGPFRSGVDIVDGVRVFAMISDANQSDLACSGGCLDVGARTIYGISDSVVVNFE